jgi:hypothetical protein
LPVLVSTPIVSPLLFVAPILPLPLNPIPPGGVAVPGQAPASAPRKEKAKKHASQSAYSIRPAGTSGYDWFYGAIGAAGLAAMLLAAAGLGRGGPSRKPAPATATVEPRRSRISRG